MGAGVLQGLPARTAELAVEQVVGQAGLRHGGLAGQFGAALDAIQAPVDLGIDPAHEE